MTVPLSVEACVSAMELSAGSGSGSFRAAFLAEHLCFANLTLGFLGVLILARRSNKEPSQPTAARRLFEFWMVARLSVLSRRCAVCVTDICCVRPRWSLLRPIVRLSEIEGHGAARWRRPPRRPEKAAWNRYSEGRDTGPRCQTAIEGHGAGHWRGPPRRPRESCLEPLFGAAEIPARAHARCQTEIVGLVAAWWLTPPRRPEKVAWDRYFGL